jgi:predicted permease
MNPLIFSINAVFPLILVAAFGFYARKTNTITDDFLNAGNKFCFKYGFFFMMFTTIYDIESFAEINWYLVLFSVAGVLLLFFIGLIYIVFFVKDSRQKGVIHQAFYRSNFAIIGMPLAMNIFGSEGLEAAAIISAFIVPLFNVLAVISLSLFVEDKQENSAKYVIKERDVKLKRPMLVIYLDSLYNK